VLAYIIGPASPAAWMTRARPSSHEPGMNNPCSPAFETRVNHSGFSASFWLCAAASTKPATWLVHEIVPNGMP